MATNVLFLMVQPSQGGAELMQAMTSFLPKGSLEAVFDVAALAERVRRPRGPDSIVIIYNPTKKELREIVSLKEFFQEGRTVLVLPDQKKETIALAHALMPAFITYVDDGNGQVVSVLKKMTGVRGEN